jgi:5-formyltetrahydrofolate cyclo-ligase
MNKHEIRAAMKLFLAGISAKDRHIRSLAACQNLASTKEFKRAQTLMIFMSMGTEIETGTLAIKAWQEGKNIAVPRVDWEHHRMEPIEINSLEVGMTTTAAGVQEPLEGMAVPLGMIDMVVIPGMAFDRNGYRIGRGKGFYDRFLAQQDFQGIRCALCYHEQLHTEAVPCEPHDMAMNLVVTDREVLHCPAPAHLTPRSH